MTANSVGGKHRLVILQTARHAGHAFAMTAFSGHLPPDAAGKWCRVTLAADDSGACWAKLELSDAARGQAVREAFFPQPRRGPRASKVLLVHVPQESGGFVLSLFTQRMAAENAPMVGLQVLGREVASLHLLAGGWRSLAAALPGSPLGLLGRARALLGQSAARRGRAPPYAVWTDLYDAWGERERHALRESGIGAGIETWIVAGADQSALAETKAALAAQWHSAEAVSVLRTPADARAPLSEWVVVLLAGERLAPHALTCLANCARQNPALLALCADIDHYEPNETRRSAGLRPSPDPWLIRSGIFADGAWMFHRSTIGPDDAALMTRTAEARLALARRIQTARMRRVPLILTHCPMPGRPIDTPPPTSPRQHGKTWPRITIIVPSACRSWHVLRCLRKIACSTDYPDFEILVAISACDPADRRQARIMHSLGTLPRVKLLALAMPAFNFAAVINKAALQSHGSLLLLLNDDVMPMTADWLRRLALHIEGDDPCSADIVGPRLLYGNGLVQHGGVIMGLGNLCEHAFRLARRADPGPQGLAHLTRQVSAVTAACLLVRRDLFESLEGLDEGFAIALNDADFCLRATQAGARIVFAADVDMYHFESLSLGRHYHGARAGLEATEVRRLRARWGFRIMADPFYHPCASLEVGREFHPGFPPRQTPLSWIAQEAPARD